MSLINLANYEAAERTLAEKVFTDYGNKITAYEFSEPKDRKPYDGSYIINPNDPSIFIEIKVRSFPIDKYNEYILEMPKLQSLGKLNDKGYLVQYWNFFKNEDNTYDLIIFNLKWRIYLWRKLGPSIIKRMWCNAQTFRSSERKTVKEVVMLTYDDTMDIKITGRHWCLN